MTLRATTSVLILLGSALTMYDVHLDDCGLDEVARVARVLAAVLRPRLLDDERADGHGRAVRDHAHAAAGGRVVDGLEGR